MTGRHSAKTPSQRQLRVGEEIRHALADLLRRGDFRDPALHDLNVTVTEVQVSPDLRSATAFVTPLGGAKADETVAALERVAPFLRGQIARTVRLRFAPALHFAVDTSFAYASRIGELLRLPDVARDLAAGHPLHERMNGEEDESEDDDLDGETDLDPEYDDDDDDDDWDEDEEIEYEDDDAFVDEDEDEDDEIVEYEEDDDEVDDPAPPRGKRTGDA